LTNEPDKAKFIFEPLSAKHGRAAFSCGVEALDSYLQKQASQDAKKRAAAVFVLTPDGKTIAGYYTLSQYAIELVDVPEEIAKKLPKYPLVSATLLGRMAVSVNFRGKGFGEALLMDALYRCRQLSKQVASTGVVVDAKDEAARTFYLRYGFLELPKIEKRLFLPMGTIEQLFQNQ
jgi:predicted GNAT family N-acyltransferase